MVNPALMYQMYARMECPWPFQLMYWKKKRFKLLGQNTPTHPSASCQECIKWWYIVQQSHDSWPWFNRWITRVYRSHSDVCYKWGVVAHCESAVWVVHWMLQSLWTKPITIKKKIKLVALSELSDIYPLVYYMVGSSHVVALKRYTIIKGCCDLCTILWYTCLWATFFLGF